MSPVTGLHVDNFFTRQRKYFLGAKTAKMSSSRLLLLLMLHAAVNYSHKTVSAA
jgi:hypothetical protein